MLRGVITQINGRPAREVAGDHWVLQGDRGVTYSTRPTPQHQRDRRRVVARRITMARPRSVSPRKKRWKWGWSWAMT
jgi:hypothetical protein